MNPLYVLDLAAVADMRKITRYTRKHWSAAQARQYAAKLHECVEALAKGSGVYREPPGLRAGLRMMRCQHHYIFLLPRPGSPAVVLAILHERMDVLTRLEARLG